MRLEHELVQSDERAAGHGQVAGALAAGDGRGVLVDGHLTAQTKTQVRGWLGVRFSNNC